MRGLIAPFLSLVLLSGPLACGDDGGGSTGSTSSAGSTGSTGGPGASSSSGEPTTSTSGTDGSSTSDAPTSSSSSTESSGSTTGSPVEPETAVVILGDLVGDDPAAVKPSHDGLAMAGEAAAMAAGDIAHDVLLGTALVGTTEGQFLAIDRWSSDDNLDAFYADPNFQMAFGMLFDAPPSVAQYVHQEAWAQWGDMDVADGVEPHHFVLVRGRLKSADLAAMQTIHDQLALGAKDAAEALGDIAHVVYLGRQDPQEFLAIDIWGAADNIETLYTDPNFAMGFSQLFEGQATLGVYASTDWYQW